MKHLLPILALLPPCLGAADPHKLVSTTAIPGLTIPPGTTATLIGDEKSLGTASPTALAFGPKGEIYVTETHRFSHGVEDNRRHLYWVPDDIASRTTADRMRMFEKWQHQEPSTSLAFLAEKSEVVRTLRDPNASGIYQKSGVFADGFNHALDGTAAGIFEYAGTVYLACIPKIHALRDTNGDGTADECKVIQDGFGVHVSLSGHDLNGFVLGADGRIYGSVGDRGFHGTTREGRSYNLHDQGSVFRFDPDGSNFEIIHTGLRNPKEIAFDDHGNLFTVDNNCDHGDKARVVYIMDGGESGWRMGHQILLTFHKAIGIPNKIPAAWMDERMWDLPNDSQPAFLIPPVAHLTSGPSGLAYHPGTGFLESEAGRFFICDYRGGAANSGIWSFRMEPEGAGMKMIDARQLNWGVAATDVDFSWDGKLTVTDFLYGWQSHAKGRIYSVTADQPFRAEAARQVPTLVREGFEHRTAKELESLLAHPDQRIRIRAQLALTRKPEAMETFMHTVNTSADPVARLHGVWGLGILARRGAAVLPDGTSATTHPDIRHKAGAALQHLAVSAKDNEIRCQSVKALGESGLTLSLPFAQWINAGSPRLKFFAALAAGRMKDKAAMPALLDMLAETTDLHLRHAGSHALSLIESSSSLAKLATHPNPAVRLSTVVALRKQQSTELAAFLLDADTRVACEAIRAINDLDLAAVRPQVAALLDQTAPPARPAMIWQRLLHSAYRSGGETNARRLIRSALDRNIPTPVRSEAFRLLSLWGQPITADQSTGSHAPLPAHSTGTLRPMLDASISQLLQVDGSLLDASLKLLKQFGIDLATVSDSDLRGIVTSEAIPGAARMDALEIYLSRKPAGMDALIRELTASADDTIAIAALRHLIEASPESAREPLSRAASSASSYRQQQAWKLTARLPTAAATQIIIQGLDHLRQSNGIAPGALELLESAAQRKEPEVVAALAAFQKAQASSTDALAKWLPSLEGGDPQRGGELFESHAAAQCMRCHAAGHGGGNAGPDLSDIGNRVDRRYLLEALANPAAQVAIGYGIASATLKGGKVVAGVIVAETKDHVDFDSAGTIQRVRRSDIQSMTPPVSAMPPMAYILQPAEMRDIVAWLADQKAKPARKPKRPPPVLVTP